MADPQDDDAEALTPLVPVARGTARGRLAPLPPLEWDEELADEEPEVTRG